MAKNLADPLVFCAKNLKEQLLVTFMAKNLAESSSFFVARIY
jgi:hypothetical protein